MSVESRVSENHNFGHIVGYRTLVVIAVILACLTGLTVYASRIDFGAAWINIIIAMLIATTKAILVGLWFMHLKFEDHLIWLFVAFPLLILGLLIGFSLGDDFLRLIPGVNF